MGCLFRPWEDPSCICRRLRSATSLTLTLSSIRSITYRSFRDRWCLGRFCISQQSLTLSIWNLWNWWIRSLRELTHTLCVYEYIVQANLLYYSISVGFALLQSIYYYSCCKYLQKADLLTPMIPSKISIMFALSLSWISKHTSASDSRHQKVWVIV